MGESPPRISGSAKGNIESIAQIEQDFVRQRSNVDRLGEAVIRLAGSIGFAIVHICVVASWVAINSGTTAVRPFDPYPFSFLGVLVSLEAVFLSTFVLMNQKRQARQAEHWVHLSLQIALLSEQEATKTLQMLTMVCNHLGMTTSQDHTRSRMPKQCGNTISRSCA